MRKNLQLILSAVVVCFFTASNLFAQYNEAELQGLRDFLIQESGLPDGPYKNAQPYNYFCVSGTTVDWNNGGLAEDNAAFQSLNGDDWKTELDWITTLKGVAFESNRITGINWSNLSANPVGGCGGTLDLSASDKLVSFICNASSLTELILNGTSINGDIDVKGNALTKFDIINVTEEDNGMPVIWLSGMNKFDCTGNKLTFASMPQIQVLSTSFLNLYWSANQADSTNSVLAGGTGNELKTAIDLRSDYYLDYTDASQGLYGPTDYTWKKSNGDVIVPASSDNGIFVFEDKSLENEEVYCEITNNLFGYYDESSDPRDHPYDNPNCYLILKYNTTLLPKTPTGISNPEDVSISVYISVNTLYVSNNEVPVKSVTVFDLSGKQLYAGVFNTSEVTVDASTWEKGVYIVKVTSDAGVFTQKVMRK